MLFRVIYYKDRLTHTKPLFDDIGAMNVYEINVCQILSFMFKCKNKLVPQIFHKLYNIKSYGNHNIRSFTKLVEPFCRNKFTEFSISFRGPKLWNAIAILKLPDVHTISHTVFKKKVKSFLSSLDDVFDYF